MKKSKPWSEMTAEELAAATHEFDDPRFDPPARKPPARELAALRRVQKKVSKDRLRIAMALEKDLIEQVDEYAASHGISFSDLVSDALRQLLAKKSA